MPCDEYGDEHCDELLTEDSLYTSTLVTYTSVLLLYRF